MEISHLLSFAFIASLLVISPGPNGLLILKTVPTSGKKAGFANVAGFAVAFYVHGALSILGISIILVQSAGAFLVVKMLGAAYLCWIGIKALRDAWNGDLARYDVKSSANPSSIMSAFIEGFLTNVLNPKTSMFYLAAFPQFIPHGTGNASAAFLLVFVHSILNFVWFSIMVMLFGRFIGTIRNSLYQRWLKGITGLVFVGFGAKLAWLKP